MPHITFMSWNIQEFGNQMVTRGNYVALCNFIARAAFNQGADILAIMELRQAGIPHLFTLAQALNNIYGAKANGNWYYDWINASVRQDIDGGAINNAADLAPDADHHEGYAVFWNDARHAAFTMIGTRGAYSNGAISPVIGCAPARIPANILSLVLEGRPPGVLGENNWFNSPKFNPEAPLVGWNNLDFCRSKTLCIGRHQRGGPRRPCFFVIEIQGRAAPKNTPADRFVPFIIYHATSHFRSRRLNTQLAGYSRQLYQIDDNSLAINPNPNWITVNNALIAGDFNIDANRREHCESGGVAYDAYTVFTNSFDDEGAACKDSWIDIRSKDVDGVPNTPKTTVQLNWPLVKGNPIDSNDVADYKRLAIDNIFYRIDNNVRAVNDGYQPIYDLLTAIIDGNLIHNVAPNVIKEFFNFDILGDDIQLGFRILFGRFSKNPNAWINTLNDKENACKAAKFINKYISDHLPVTIRLDFR